MIPKDLEDQGEAPTMLPFNAQVWTLRKPNTSSEPWQSQPNIIPIAVTDVVSRPAQNSLASVCAVCNLTFILPWNCFLISSELKSEDTIICLKVYKRFCCRCLVAKSCLTLQPPGLYPTRLLCPISQARILEWVSISRRGSSRPRDRILTPCIAR